MTADIFVAVSTAQTPAASTPPASNPPAAQTSKLQMAAQASQERLEKAKQELAALRAKIEADTLPLANKLQEVEQKLGTTRNDVQGVDRVLSGKQLENTNLQSSVKLKTEENAYLASIMDEFVRGFETRLFSGELPRYKPIIDEAKLVMTNQEMSSSDKFARQIAAVKAALTRLQDVVGGSRFPGKAVDSKGNLIDGTFVLLGPATYFSAKFGDVLGLAVPQLSSPNPIVRAFPDPGDIGEPHEKVMHWFASKFGSHKEESRPGLKEVVAATPGWLPIDPSKGAALRDMVEKFNLIETFIHGGWIMWPILAASIAAFTVVIERVFFIFNETRKRSRKKLEQFFARCEANDLDGAIAVSKTTKDFVVRALGYALEHREASLHSALMYSAQTATKRFNRGLVVLDTVITLAPMLGLLGTVTGMMGSFQAIGGDNGNPTAVMGGISEALIATAAGLGIALICLLPYNYLNAKIEEAQKDLETATARLELLVQVSEQVALKLKEPPSSGPTPYPTSPTHAHAAPYPEKTVGDSDSPLGQPMPA
jgi:biopolymer transport protein ExbB